MTYSSHKGWISCLPNFHNPRISVCVYDRHIWSCVFRDATGFGERHSIGTTDTCQNCHRSVTVLLLVLINEVNLCRAWVSTEMNDRVRVPVPFILVYNQPPRPTQPSIFLGSVNEDHLRLGRQRQTWFIPLADAWGSAGKTVRSLDNPCHTCVPYRCYTDPRLSLAYLTFELPCTEAVVSGNYCTSCAILHYFTD